MQARTTGTWERDQTGVKMKFGWLKQIQLRPVWRKTWDDIHVWDRPDDYKNRNTHRYFSWLFWWIQI
jgi:hypothetical protein